MITFGELREKHGFGKKTDFYTKEEKQKILEAAFKDINIKDSQRDLIFSIIPRIDYEGFIRSVFKAEEIEPDYFDNVRKALQDVRNKIDIKIT